MSEVIAFSGHTKLDIEPARVLEAAVAHNLETVLVLGLDSEGGLYAAGSTSDVAAVLYMIETFKHKLLSGNYGELEKPI